MTLELVPWRGARVPVLKPNEITRYTTQDYINWITSTNRYMGPPAPVTTYGTRPAEPISYSFQGFVEGMLYADGPVAAAEAYRLRVFGQAPLLYQELVDGRAGDMFDDPALDRLRAPWTGATLSDLMKRSLVYGDFAGNAFALDLEDELVLVRPDWVEIILEKRMYRGGQVGWRQVGIMYYEGGLRSGDGVAFLPGEYAHFVPGLPDPLATYRGMSWLTPLVREVQADKAAMDHKVAFFEHAASPNLAVSLPKEITPTQFAEFVDKMDAQHRGALNAGKTLYTAGGADVTVIGANMQQMDFSSVLGKGETRVANAAGVPPTLLSFSEGMQGSSLNAGNYTAAKRNFVDTTMRDLWSNFAGSVQQMDAFKPPKEKSRLWYDARDIPFLHEDAKDLADIQQTRGSTVNSYVREGWTPESSIAAVANDDITLLKHTGLTSVQLMPPGSQDTDGDGTPDAEAAAADEYAAALDEFRAEFADDEDFIERKYYDIRVDAGHKGGGRFRKLGDVAAKLLDDWLSGKGDKDDPLEDFKSQPQLKKIAEQLGVAVPPRSSANQIKLAILKDARDRFVGAKSAKSPDIGKPVRFTLTGGSVDPKLAREVEVENKIRAAYRKATQGPGKREWVSLADIRDELSDLSREEQDQALDAIRRQDGVRVLPIHNTKGLTDREYAAALQISGGAGRGGHDLHAISIEDPSPRPVPTPAGKLRDLDVTLHTESNGKVSLWETSDSGERRRRVALVDDLAGLESWADEHGESELAGWARQERGGAEAPTKAAPTKATKPKASSGAPQFDLQQAMRDEGVTDAEIAQIRELVRIHAPRIMIGNEATESFSGIRGLRATEPALATFYEAHPDIFNHLAQQRRMDQEWLEQWSPHEVDEAKRKATQAVRRAVAPTNPTVARMADEGHLRQLLADGRFKTQHETGTSSGFVDTTLRTDYEAMAFGLPRDAPADKRPVYGYVAVGGLDADTGERLAQFGDIRIVMRPDVRDRTTVSVGDSLDKRHELNPMPIDQPDWHAVRPYLADFRLNSKTFRDGHYVEAQIHDGVRTGDIAEVRFARQPDPATVEALDRAGVSWQVDASPTPAKVTKTAKKAAPTAQPVDLSHLRTLDPEAARDELDLRTVVELKALLKAQGLPVSGKKRELVDRLVESLGGGAAPSAPAAKSGGRAPATPVPIHDLFKAETSDAQIEAALKDVFEGKFGPYTTKADVHITRAGTRVDKRGREHKVEPSIGVDGKIYDEQGHEIGYFSRSIGPIDMHYADGRVVREMWAEHHVVQLGGGDYDANPTKYHGKGFGGEFNRRAIEWYRASGVHGIGQKDHNGYVWASQGFNFGQGGRVPDYQAANIRQLITDLRAGRTTTDATKDEYHTIPKRFREAPDLDAQIAEAEALLARLDSTKPGEPDYPTAYEISQLGRRAGQRGKTSLWLGKLLWVSADQMILNPDEGEVISP